MRVEKMYIVFIERKIVSMHANLNDAINSLPPDKPNAHILNDDNETIIIPKKQIQR